MTERSAYRALPAVDRLLSAPAVQLAVAAVGATQATAIARAVLADARSAIAAGNPTPSLEALADAVAERAAELGRLPIRPVINATGVIIHTNLGRAPLAPAAIAAMRAVTAGYSNLEFQLDAGQRGSRDQAVERLICAITGAESALAVNNNAAALVLALSALATGREVIVSRGQAVEIGGGFRIPDVMRQSGARLVEVGTTNRTYLRDYEAAITPDTAALLRVHSSNFKIIGFAHEATIDELARLATEHGLTLIDDVGSGCLLDTRPFGLAAEPTVQASIAAGVGVVCFSGDKLLGGPQAGILAGKKVVIDRARRHPLARAVRIDKATLAGLAATLQLYLRGDALREIPVWRMIAMSPESIKARADAWARQVGGEVVPGESTVGGGSLPGETLPTFCLAIAPAAGVDAVARALRLGDPPIVARIERDRLLFDPRTVFPDDDTTLLGAISRVAT